jgi:hypothetical protein
VRLAGPPNPLQTVVPQVITPPLTGVTALDVVGALALSAEQRRDGEPKDMSGRTGYPNGIGASRAAAKDFKVPRDMRAAVGA